MRADRDAAQITAPGDCTGKSSSSSRGHTNVPRPRGRVLRQRISTLSAAIVCISSALDRDTVLADVVESVHWLSGASVTDG